MGATKISDRVMDVREVAEMFGIHENKIRDLAHAGKIPGAFRLDKRILFSRTRVERFLSEPTWLPRTDDDQR